MKKSVVYCQRSNSKLITINRAVILLGYAAVMFDRRINEWMFNDTPAKQKNQLLGVEKW